MSEETPRANSSLAAGFSFRHAEPLAAIRIDLARRTGILPRMSLYFSPAPAGKRGFFLLRSGCFGLGLRGVQPLSQAASLQHGGRMLH
jgi:hypothetical protein